MSRSILDREIVLEPIMRRNNVQPQHLADVSLIIPYFQAETTIVRALRSVAAQTLLPKEVIVLTMPPLAIEVIHVTFQSIGLKFRNSSRVS